MCYWGVSNAIFKIMKWPTGHLLLTILMIAVRDASVAAQLLCDGRGEELLNYVASVFSTDSATSQLVAVRILCNLFGSKGVEPLVVTRSFNLMPVIIDQIQGHAGAPYQDAVTSLLLNLVTRFVKTKDSHGLKQLFRLANDLLLRFENRVARFNIMVVFNYHPCLKS